MIIETYQEQQSITQQEPPGQAFAIVGTVYEDGIALIFNGAETESLKHYKCNSAARFESGQRVRIIEDSGTYIVEYPVGVPAQSIFADSAARASYATEAGHAENASKATLSTRAERADSADRAIQVENKAGKGADLEFYYDTQGALYIRALGDAQWTKFTGTAATLD